MFMTVVILLEIFLEEVITRYL